MQIHLRGFRRYLAFVSFLLPWQFPAAQPLPPQTVYVDKITLEGNKRTRSDIILRELLFQEGDSLQVSELSSLLERSEKLILNTGLFNEASIVFKNWEGSTNRIHLHIKVEETWYLYPVPIFELADRNFNVWWVEQKRSLDRVNYGVEFTHLNTTGRRDRLQLTLQYGYTHLYRLDYDLPFVNRGKTWGITGQVRFSRNREVNYATEGNKQQFFKDEGQFVYQQFLAEGGIVVRPGLRTSHLFLANFRQNVVDERVGRDLNPAFFLDGRTRLRYLSLAYRYAFENRDVRFYPWSGNYFAFALEKNGIGPLNDRQAFTAYARYDQHFPFSDKWSLAMSLRGKTSLMRVQQPYLDNRALGFGSNTPHGFEYYIVDGLDMALLKTSLHWKFLSWEMNFGKLMPIPAFRRMPLKVFLSLNNDAAFANDPFSLPGNFLHNKLLWGGGLGLDFLMFYDKVVRVEYSINHLGENGLFLHLDLNI